MYAAVKDNKTGDWISISNQDVDLKEHIFNLVSENGWFEKKTGKFFIQFKIRKRIMQSLKNSKKLYYSFNWTQKCPLMNVYQFSSCLQVLQMVMHPLMPASYSCNLHMPHVRRPPTSVNLPVLVTSLNMKMFLITSSDDHELRWVCQTERVSTVEREAAEQ